MPTDQEIERSVKARAAAIEVAQLARGEAPADERGAAEYWQKIAAELADVLPRPRPLAPSPRASAVPPMTNEQVEKFIRMKVPYGRHAGKSVSETPLVWFDWLVGESSDHFKGLVQRYLAREDVQRKLALELEARKCGLR